MEVTINMSRLSLTRGDITKEFTDAIVNAANKYLAGGDGVDGAIHRAGGPVIMQECQKICYCSTGNAVITSGGNLKARYVIHTVGPRYQDGRNGEATLLRSAYLESLKLASAQKLKSIAFPAISTGVYGYPVRMAAAVALATTIEYLKTHNDIELVRFVLFDYTTYDTFSEELRKLL